MKRTTRNILLKSSLILGITTFVVLFAAAKIRRDNSAVNEINVRIENIQGNYFFTNEYIIDYLKEKYPLTGKTIQTNDLVNIENDLLEIPQIKVAEAYFDNNNNLNINIRQREPIARVFNKSGQTFYIDTEGKKFPVSLQYTAKVVTITGNITELSALRDTLNTKTLKNLYKILQEVRNNKFWESEFSQYDIQEHGDIIATAKLGDFDILIEPEQIKEQLNRLDIFYSEGLTNIGWDSIQSIDLRYKNQVVVKKITDKKI